MARTIISTVYPNVEVTAVVGGRVGDTPAALPLPIDFDEISLISLSNISVI
jgi:hypothetical protein